jgi:hypothetical protein
MPFTNPQKAVLDAKAWAVHTAPPFIHPSLSFFNPPADSDSFTVTPSPFVPYPAVGASAIPVIVFTVPRSKLAIIYQMSIVHVGGNPPDGTGQVIWRVVKNGGGLRGLAGLTSQYGTYAAPKKLSIYGIEVDTFQVTVECPAFLPDGSVNPGPSAGSTTAASFDGFMYSLTEATLPLPGNY